MRDRLAAASGVCVVLTTIAGCTPGPLSRPATGAPMNNPVAVSSDPSSGSVETARRALQGTWQLAALEIAQPGETARAPVQAAGGMTYDEFGNLTIDVHTSDPAAPVAAREVSRVSFKGRAVIDVVNKELRLMDLTGNVNPDEVLAPERRRRYEFDGDLLKLSSIDERGQVTAIATWRRVD